jgi:ribosomal protein S18 acetylase RimI-like enzyme
VDEIEEALVGHWSHFGRWPHGALVEEAGTLRYETPLVQLPYNGVIRTQISGDAEAVIESVLASFAAREVSCLWWHHPTATPSNIGEILSAHGLRLVEVAIGMSLDIRDRTRPQRLESEVDCVEVASDELMRTYSGLIFRYWEVPPESQELVEDVNRYWGPGRTPIHRWVALDALGEPIGKALLSLAAPSGVAAIYGMSVTPEARGKGVASTLTEVLLDRAESLGCRRVVLHSSEMAVGMYERAGFTRQCEMPVYANAALWASRAG